MIIFDIYNMHTYPLRGYLFYFSEGAAALCGKHNFNLPVFGIIPCLGRAVVVRVNPTNVCRNSNSSSSSTMRFIHINEYEYMNNYVQYIILHTRIRICI